MLKAAIIACSICASAGGAAFWVKSNPADKRVLIPASRLASFQQFHDNAHLDNLPIQVVPDPY